MRPSPVRSIARLRMIVASLVAIDAAAALWIIPALFLSIDSAGLGPSNHYHECYAMYDGSAFTVTYDYTTGKTIERTMTQPPTTAGLYRVWWPMFIAGPVSLLGLALVVTRRGRRFVDEFPLPRLTTRWLMLAVAVLGADGGLILRALEFTGGHLWITDWTPGLVDLVILHALAFMAVGVALLFWFARCGVRRIILKQSRINDERRGHIGIIDPLAELPEPK